ncbi:unnamed protein product [Amoebophrya sp. A120]|nr:unnamed protein product [Amoebophrya sp. A120]|eukprot:GSA120T00018965001.1
MSDVESVAASVPVEEEVTDLGSAVRRVCKNALAVDGLARGLHEGAKVIDAGKAQFVFLSESCDEPAYKKLVKALCAEKQVPLYEVPDSKKLGEWAGLCKIDSDGNARKVVGASCVVVHDYGDESEGLNWLRNNTSS